MGVAGAMSRLAAGASMAVLGAFLGVGILVVLEGSPAETIVPVATAATEAPASSAHSGQGTRTSAAPASARAADIARPARVRIPTLGVDADLVGLGLNPDRSMEVPDFGRAGWYELGPRPGAPGPAVIAAHVDSVDGPDVFHRLTELERGDTIVVEHADGSRSRFVVRDAEQRRKEDLPVDRIWNDTDRAVLRLITCGGRFDAQERSYDSNVIVYAASAKA